MKIIPLLLNIQSDNVQYSQCEAVPFFADINKAVFSVYAVGSQYPIKVFISIVYILIKKSPI